MRRGEFSNHSVTRALMKLMLDKKNLNYNDPVAVKALLGEELIIEAIEDALKVKVNAIKALGEGEAEPIIDVIEAYIGELKKLLIKIYREMGLRDFDPKEIDALIEGLEASILVSHINQRYPDDLRLFNIDRLDGLDLI